MAIVVEDGTGKTDAESYLSISDLGTYWAKYGYSAGTLTEAQKEALVIRATNIIDYNFQFDGIPTSTTQALSFPRTGCYTKNGNIIASNVIPDKLKNAVAELAYYLTTQDFVSVQEDNIASESYGVVSKTYRVTNTTGFFGSKRVPMVDLLLKDFLCAPSMRLIRG